MFVINYLVIIVLIFLSVAFFTLLERKILSYTQIRKGPNKVFFLGILQPISDAIKLIFKRRKIPYISNFFIFFFSPFLSLLLILIIWILYFSSSTYIYIYFRFIFFLCVRRISVYPILRAGWSSNSKYSFIGALRGASQIVSYEIRLVIFCFFVFLFTFSLNFFRLLKRIWFICFVSPIWFICWFFLLIAETNRAPFDFAEGESELVSGFNTEYSRGGFAIIFLSEYGNILFLAILRRFFILNSVNYLINCFAVTLFFCILIIVIRSTFPRLRYDLFIILAWQVFLLRSFFFVLFLIILYYINIFTPKILNCNFKEIFIKFNMPKNWWKNHFKLSI